MSTLLDTRGLTKRFRDALALDDVTLALPPGTTTVLLGPNGAGKSTLLKLALGCLAPDAGTLAVCGLDPLREPRRVRELVGYVPDRPDAPEWMTPRELFAFLAPQYPRWSAATAERLLARFDVPLDRAFAKLSRGQGAKAMLIAAVAQRPRLLLLDEPFAGLDPLARDELLQGFLGELPEDGGALVVTHELDVAARIADRVIVLAQGRVRAQGTLEEVLASEDEPAEVPAGLHELLRRTSAPASMAETEVAA